MKIALLITTLGYGGAERQLVTLSKALQQRGHEMCVAYLKSGGELATELQSCGIPVKHLGMKHSLDARVYFRVRAWLKEHAPDLLHTHLFKADVFGGYAAHSLGIPVISTKCAQDQYLKNPLFAFLARRIGKRNARIICVSEAVARFMKEIAGLEGKNLMVIPIGIPLSETNRSRFVESSLDTVRFGAVARMYPQKGHSILLKAFAAVSESMNGAQLLLFGSGPLESKLRRMVERLGLTERVKFCGQIANPDTIYEQIDVLVVPSLSEGAGVVLLEAMLRGIPIIASNVGGIGEIVNDQCAMLVPPGDAKALAKTMLVLTENVDLRSRMAIATQERIRRFDFENTATRHELLYQQVLEGLKV